MVIAQAAGHHNYKQISCKATPLWTLPTSPRASWEQGLGTQFSSPALPTPSPMGLLPSSATKASTAQTTGAWLGATPGPPRYPVGLWMQWYDPEDLQTDVTDA